MDPTEKTARTMCSVDLQTRGYGADQVAALVERYWPAVANEIRQGTIDERSPLSPAETEALCREYQALLGKPES